MQKDGNGNNKTRNYWGRKQKTEKVINKWKCFLLEKKNQCNAQATT